jgi:hypothetical protein
VTDDTIPLTKIEKTREEPEEGLVMGSEGA